MVMQFFRSERSRLLERIAESDWADDAEKQALLAQAAGSSDYRLTDLVFMLTHADLEVVRYTLAHALPQATTSEVFAGLSEAWLELPADSPARPPLLEALAQVRHEPLGRQLKAWFREGDAEAGLALAVLLAKGEHPALLSCWAEAAQVLRGPARATVLERLFEGELWRKPTLKKCVAALARDDDPRVRGRYVDALLAHQVAPTAGALRGALEDPAPEVRARGRALLAQGGVKPHILLPLTCLAEEDTRALAVRTLLATETPDKAVPRLVRYLAARPAAERERGLLALQAAEAPVPRELFQLFGAASGEVRRLAGQALLAGEGRPATEAARALLGDEEVWTRLAALDCLARNGCEEAVLDLVALIPEVGIRSGVIEALVAIGGRRASDVVNRLLTERDPELRAEVLEAIERYCAADAAELLAHMAANDPDAANRAYAAGVVARLGAPRPSPPALPADLAPLVAAGEAAGADDLFLRAGQVPVARVAGGLLSLDEVAPPSAPQLAAWGGWTRSAGQGELVLQRPAGALCARSLDGGELHLRLDGGRLPAPVLGGVGAGLLLLAAPGAVFEAFVARAVAVLGCGPAGHALVLGEGGLALPAVGESLVHQLRVGRELADWDAALGTMLAAEADAVLLIEPPGAILEAACRVGAGHLLVLAVRATGAEAAWARVLAALPDRARSARLLAGHLRRIAWLEADGDRWRAHERAIDERARATLLEGAR